MHEAPEARAAAGCGLLLQIAIGIAKRKDWAAADVHLDANRLSSLIVYKIELGQLRQHGLAVT